MADSKKTKGETVTVRFERARGYGGAIMARGSVVDLPAFWANAFIDEGTAVRVEPKKAKPTGKKEK